MKSPIVCIGIPVYNGENFLSDAIESVLAQTMTEFELIISDNASTDSTPEIAADYARRDKRIRYVRHPKNLGAAANFNYVLEASSSPYFAWLAHDDILAPEYLRECVDHLERHPAAVLAFAETDFIDAGGKTIASHRYPLPASSNDMATRFLGMVKANHIVVEVFGVIRRDVLAETNGIGPYMASDMVLLSELLLHGPFIRIEKTLFFHREHEGRSVNAHRDPLEREKWFDSSKGSSYPLPSWRRLVEHARVFARTEAPLKDRLRILAGLARVTYWQKGQLLAELGKAGREYLRRSR